jgi:hypothetical protein
MEGGGEEEKFPEGEKTGFGEGEEMRIGVNANLGKVYGLDDLAE